MPVPTGPSRPTVAALLPATFVVPFSLPPLSRPVAPRPRRSVVRWAMLTLLAGAATTAMPAQVVVEGYAQNVQALPNSAGNVLRMPNGELVWCDGSDLWMQTPGRAAKSLRHFAPPVFASFTLALDRKRVLLGESSTHGLHVVTLTTTSSNQPPLANVPFNYDAAVLSPGRVVVSAKTGGFSAPDNDLLVVDVANGNVQTLARIPGASGPIAVAPDGDLYYATGSMLYPTPPGTSSVVRFPRPIVDQALATNQVLGSQHAQVVFAGLDAAADLAFDDDGDLLFTDWWNNALGELHDATGPAPWRTTLVDYAGGPLGPSGVQFLAAAGPAVFEPFQPTGGTLLVHETTWGTTSQVRSLRAQLAVAATSVPSPIPAGSFLVEVTGGPRLGLGLMVFGFPPATGGAPLAVPGFEQPIFFDGSLNPGLGAWILSFDAAGRAPLALTNPGVVPNQPFLLQAAFVDAARRVVGATAPLVLQLGP